MSERDIASADQIIRRCHTQFPERFQKSEFTPKDIQLINEYREKVKSGEIDPRISLMDRELIPPRMDRTISSVDESHADRSGWPKQSHPYLKPHPKFHVSQAEKHRCPITRLDCAAFYNEKHTLIPFCGAVSLQGKNEAFCKRLKSS
jgi:hypothetical protein